MLRVGIIKPSTSPVLLIKKKDGSWHFCVNHHALNKETTPNKYLIPIIDEFLDKLHGSDVYSKLDIKYRYHYIWVRPEDNPNMVFLYS